MNNRMHPGDFILDEAAQQWLDNLKDRLARQRGDQQTVERCYRAMDDLHKFALEVKYII